MLPKKFNKLINLYVINVRLVQIFNPVIILIYILYPQGFGDS